MEYISNIIWADLDVNVKLSTYKPDRGVKEHHAIIETTNQYNDSETQFKNINNAVKRLYKQDGLKNSVLVFKRYFVSDAVNQAAFWDYNNKEAVSFIQQAPLNGTKVSVWVYFVSEGEMIIDEKGTHILVRPNFKHLYNTQMHEILNDEYTQTETIFNCYTNALEHHTCNLKDNCIRTWIFVQGVDIHYKKMVEARIACFDKEGLTKNTHYIASTGIEGSYINPKSLVLIDAYAIKGISAKQIKHLLAPTHLNPTHEYGVTFERATSVDYSDRRHIFISGTASINNEGKIVHNNDVKKQIERTIENIKALLNEAESGMDDVAQMIVYLRDTADYQIAACYFEEYYPAIPKVIVWAPVCRPGWLVEVECIAIKRIENNDLKKF